MHMVRESISDFNRLILMLETAWGKVQDLTYLHRTNTITMKYSGSAGSLLGVEVCERVNALQPAVILVTIQN